MVAKGLQALLLCAAIVVAGALHAAAVRVEPAFGYRIGDSIVATGRFAVDERARLDQESLPKAGRINGWLELREISVTAGVGYRDVVRVFLVTASDIAPRLLFLPKAELTFRLDGREFTEQLEAVPISVSPLTGAEPIRRTGFGELRPDRDVPVPDAAGAARRAIWLAGILFALAAVWAGLRLLAMRRPGFAPFGRAAARLRRLARSGGGGTSQEDHGRAAFRILHDAFNQSAGEALFASQVDRFLSRHPRLGKESAAVHEFFRRSDTFFFAGGLDPGGATASAVGPAGSTGTADLAWLAGLARRLARLEERGR